MADGFLHGVEVVEVATGARPVRSIDTGTIGLVGTAPGLWTGAGPAAANPVDTPVLVAGAADAAAKVGAGFGTIPDALAAIEAQGVSPRVVVVNVLDPAVHKAAVALADHVMAGGVASLAHKRVQHVLVVGVAVAVAAADGALAGGVRDLGEGYVTDVVVQNEAGDTTYVEGTDYALDPVAATVTRIDGGGIAADDTVLKIGYNRRPIRLAGMDYELDALAGTVTRIEGGAIATASATVGIAYDRLDETAVTGAQAAGSAADGGGAYALVGAQSETGAKPKVLVAPGFSDQQTVADALIAVANRLRGVAVIEGPDTNEAAAIAYRANFDSRRAYVVDPGAKAKDADDATVARPMSAYVAGVIAKTDADFGYWTSPSNRPLLGIVGTGRPVDFALGDPASHANLLNEHGVATVIRESGWRLWGNRTCSSDAKWQFLSVVRIADAIDESLLSSHLWAADRGIGRTYLEDVAEGVNAFLRELRGLGAILGGRCVPSPDLNTTESIAAGRVYFDFDFTPAYPAERVTFRSHLTNDYIESIL